MYKRQWLGRAGFSGGRLKKRFPRANTPLCNAQGGICIKRGAVSGTFTKKGHTAAREAEEPPDDVSNQEETV